jgi:hypothetical protein
MTTYTVTIAPETGVGAETIVRIDVNEGLARIREIVVRPSREQDAGDQLGGLDFDVVMRVLQPAVAAIAAGTGVAGATVAAAGDRPAATRARAGQRRAEETRTGRARSSPPAESEVAPLLQRRAYRRLPEDLAETFARLGSVTKVAAHYGVPRHTAQGWINRLRSKAGA